MDNAGLNEHNDVGGGGLVVNMSPRDDGYLKGDIHWHVSCKLASRTKTLATEAKCVFTPVWIR